MDPWLFVENLYEGNEYLLIFLGAFLENTIFLSYIWPGGVMVVLGSYFILERGLSLPLAIFLSWLGLILSAVFNYIFGAYGVGFVLKRGRWGGAFDRSLERAKNEISAHGIKAIFFSYIFGTIRSFLSVACGFTRFPLRRYLIVVSFASFVWGSFYVLLGVLLGENRLLLKNILKGINLVGILIVAVFVAGKVLERVLKKKMMEK